MMRFPRSKIKLAKFADADADDALASKEAPRLIDWSERQIIICLHSSTGGRNSLSFQLIGGFWAGNIIKLIVRAFLPAYFRSLVRSFVRWLTGWLLELLSARVSLGPTI